MAEAQRQSGNTVSVFAAPQVPMWVKKEVDNGRFVGIKLIILCFFEIFQLKK